MRSLLELLVAVGVGSLFYQIGYNFNKLKTEIDKLKHKEPEPYITKDDPRFTNPNWQNNDSEVGVAAPKSPQLLEWEAEQALRTLNDSYKVKPE